MTNDELLNTLNSKQFMESRTAETPYFALRAIVELHTLGNGEKSRCEACWMGFNCPTIEAIEKEIL